MTLLKNMFIGIVLLFVVLIVVGFFLPSEFSVQRTVVIEAPAEEVYPHIVDLKQWKNWGVWFARDPQMKVTYSGTTAALGMKSSWQSEQEGSGEMTITALVPNKNVTYSLYFPDFDMGSTGELQLVESQGVTTVTWKDYGDVGSNPINHYFALMMDSMIGPDFEQGLSNLKTIVENQS